jgi:diguanylate cyclase (GGDEF)-like protein/PAS domain S-box-containing protein
MTYFDFRPPGYFIGGVIAATTATLFLGGPVSLVVLATAPLLITFLSYLSRRNCSVQAQRQTDEIQRLHANAVEVLRAARESEERYALAAAGSNDGLWDWNLATGVLYCSDRWKLILGLPVQASVDTVEGWFRYVHEEDLAALRASVDDHLAGRTAHFEHEYRMRRAGGDVCWVLCRGIAVRDESGHPVRMAGSQTDMTDRRRTQQALAHAATHDPLTGLPNRTLVTDLLKDSIVRTRSGGHLFAVLFIDLDGFKYVNDIFGHVEGDRLLVEVSRRLRGILRAGDVLARIGGDEFAVVVQTVPASLIAHTIQQALRKPFDIDGREVRVSASIGIAYSSPEYSTADDLLRAADTAMYHAKRTGRGRHQEFAPALRGGMSREDRAQSVGASDSDEIFYLNAPAGPALADDPQAWPRIHRPTMPGAAC